MRGRRAEPEAASAYDFLAWRAGLRQVEDVGAFRLREQNLVVDGEGEAIRFAEISAAAFRLAQLSPLYGRPLAEADEAPGADQVIVIGIACGSGALAAIPRSSAASCNWAARARPLSA